ncbi:MAG: hypothetical protein LBI58_01520 [Tannerellaceae bacterium]|jgi:hypothetical protein|nr:hypothetical protein [Tannerellaceae bacterium]
MKTNTQKSLNNQAIGLLPLLTSMILDLYVSHVISFIAGFTLALFLLGFFHLLVKKDIYQFLLLPVILTYTLYSVFLLFDIGPSLDLYSPIIAEVLLVSILGFAGFFKRSLLLRVRRLTLRHQVSFKITLTEAFYVAEIVQTLYTLYLFVVLLHTHLPRASFHQDDPGFIRVFYHYTGAAIGLLVLTYEQIRLIAVNSKLKQEIWLPILNDRGHVIGRTAYSPTRNQPVRHYHPIVRVAVVYKGMIYMTRRDKDSHVSPDLLDHPFSRHILFRHSRENTVDEIIGSLREDSSARPRFMIHYTFENKKVKQLVSLYTIILNAEDQLKTLAQGKLWTAKQIESNLTANIFSEYFHKEFPYLQNTVLLAEKTRSTGTARLI